MRVMLLCAAVSGLALTACAKPAQDGSASSNTAVNADASNVSETATENPVVSAQTFVDTIAASDKFEIESGKLASAKATNGDLKSFGDMLVKDHTKSSADLKAAAAKATQPLNVPTALPADLQAKLDALKGAEKEAFDSLFKSQQIEGHQTALATLQAYASSGDQMPLTDFASKASPVVQQHLDLIKK